jgi:hypothetical protein
MSNSNSDVKFSKTVGIGPDKLCARYNRCRFFILPIPVGIEPDNIFMDKLSVVRPFILLRD